MTLEAREVEWGHPEAFELRRAMWEHYRPMFPEASAEAEATYGGFAGVDAFVGRRAVATVLVSEDGRPLGVGSLRTAPRLGPEVGEVSKVFVVPEARGRGVARLVMAELEAIARRQGFDRLVLDTNRGNLAAVALYENLGFEHIDPTRPDGRVSMAKSIRPATSAGSAERAG